MDLLDIVRAILTNNNVTDKDIKETIYYLVEDADIEIQTMREIVKYLNKLMEFEDSPIS